MGTINKGKRVHATVLNTDKITMEDFRYATRAADVATPPAGEPMSSEPRMYNPSGPHYWKAKAKGDGNAV